MEQQAQALKLIEIDRISLLPDCLLIDILSCLPTTKEAIKTCTLSKRWQHLWPQLPNLIFNNQLFSGLYSLVDKTITQSRQLNLNRFKLSIVAYDIRFESQVNELIHYAINRNVQQIDVALLTRTYCVSEHKLDQMLYVNPCLTHLSLRGCILNPTCSINWRNLKCLCIARAKVDEDLIKNILSGSPVLETLDLRSCYGYKRLDITSKSVKNLVFAAYGNLYCEHALGSWELIIKINAPYILSLTIGGWLMLSNLLLLNVSTLVKAELNYIKDGNFVEEEEMLKGMILKLRHVNKLKLGNSCLHVLSRLKAKGFTIPSSMKSPDMTSPLL
ncbi:F-box protein-like protein [Tanacetum coccineum]|uniref:F-box protein-like protein n=1 Tax=Tanacetum coccineum TaxID=301880 RepID=A0ABQ5HSW3_9ASTR